MACTRTYCKLNIKQPNCLKWDDFFMETALLASKRSKDPATKVGACIANPENRIVGVGYNGAPNGWNDDDFPWSKVGKPLETKHLFVCHAELNAIVNKNCADLKNCVIYVTLCPCNTCAKLIIQSGIKEVVYISDKDADKDETKASKMMFDAVKIKYRQYITEDSSAHSDDFDKNPAPSAKKMIKNK